MKQLLSLVLTACFASTLLIGCGFVDNNPSYVEPDEPARLETTYGGTYAVHDTTGNEDWP